MKIDIHLESNKCWAKCKVPYEGAPHVEVQATVYCRTCGASPLLVAGRDPVEGHDTITSTAVCVVCGAYAGKLRVTVDTIFGLEEDRRVLEGRWRVY